MSGSIQWIKYQGKEILFNNRSGLRQTEIIENVKNAVGIIKTSGKKDILYLVDNSDTIIIPEVKDFIKQAGKELTPYIKKTAVLGTNKAQGILINVLSSFTGLNIKTFADELKAKEWLAN